MKRGVRVPTRVREHVPFQAKTRVVYSSPVSGKAWALSQKHTPSRGCETCAFARKVPAFGRFVAEAWGERTAGRAPHVTRRGLHAYVVENFEYPLTDGALRGHVERCLSKSEA